MKKIILISLAVIVIVGLVFGAGIVYDSEIKRTEVLRQQSPNEEYELVVYQVGAPKWSFGPVKAQLKLIDKKEKNVDKTEVFSVNNDGASLTEYSIDEVFWHKEQVTVTISDEQGTQSYTLCAPTVTMPEEAETNLPLFYDTLDDEFVKTVALNLELPNLPNITYTVGEPFYWSVGQRSCVEFDFFEDGNFVAGAFVDDKTGELVRNIAKYNMGK